MNDLKKGSVSLLFGLPTDKRDDEKLLSDFFSEGEAHIVCGGSTAARVASYLGKSLSVDLVSDDPDVPPMAHIEGVTLVTEGILTVRQVPRLLKTAKTAVFGKDGASQIAKYLAEASNIVFHVGLAESAEKASLGLRAAEKAELIYAISEILTPMGITVKTVIYP